MKSVKMNHGASFTDGEARFIHLHSFREDTRSSSFLFTREEALHVNEEREDASRE